MAMTTKHSKRLGRGKGSPSAGQRVVHRRVRPKGVTEFHNGTRATKKW